MLQVEIALSNLLAVGRCWNSLQNKICLLMYSTEIGLVAEEVKSVSLDLFVEKCRERPSKYREFLQFKQLVVLVVLISQTC